MKLAALAFLNVRTAIFPDALAGRSIFLSFTTLTNQL